MNAFDHEKLFLDTKAKEKYSFVPFPTYKALLEFSRSSQTVEKFSADISTVVDIYAVVGWDFFMKPSNCVFSALLTHITEFNETGQRLIKGKAHATIYFRCAIQGPCRSHEGKELTTCSANPHVTLRSADLLRLFTTHENGAYLQKLTEGTLKNSEYMAMILGANHIPVWYWFKSNWSDGDINTTRDYFKKDGHCHFMPPPQDVPNKFLLDALELIGNAPYNKQSSFYELSLGPLFGKLEYSNLAKAACIAAVKSKHKALNSGALKIDTPVARQQQECQFYVFQNMAYLDIAGLDEERPIFYHKAIQDWNFHYHTTIFQLKLQLNRIAAIADSTFSLVCDRNGQQNVVFTLCVEIMSYDDAGYIPVKTYAPIATCLAPRESRDSFLAFLAIHNEVTGYLLGCFPGFLHIVMDGISGVKNGLADVYPAPIFPLLPALP